MDQEYVWVKSCLTGRLIRRSVLVHTFLACERIRGTLLHAAAFSLADERHHERHLGTCPLAPLTAGNELPI